MDNPYRSGDTNHEKKTALKQTETTVLPQSFEQRMISIGNCIRRI
ncbi:hypothetical protein RCS94_04520 [Orbaceae bacterium ac157xtp]